MSKLSVILAVLAICARSAHALPHHAPIQQSLELPGTHDMYSSRETLDEAASFTRHLMRTITTGSIATVFPESSDHAGQAFNMLEYHAPCQPSVPDSKYPSLTFLLLPISLSVRNIMASDHGELTYLLREPYAWEQEPGHGMEGSWKGKGRDRGAMDHTRVALIGNMTIIPTTALDPIEQTRLSECYSSYHPDARAWLPDAKDSPHRSVWARLDIGDAYYVGGFGDRHFIGHIPVDKLVL